MPLLFELEGEDLHPIYCNLREGTHPVERGIAEALEEMYEQFAPYADAHFVDGFARDPHARFWEMYLGCALIEAGKTLAPAAQRPNGAGPDFCVLEDGRRIWIEAIAPERGTGEDRIHELIPLNQGGRLQPHPTRQVQLRVTSSLRTKSDRIDRYREDGIVRPDDIAIVAVGAARFGIHAGGPGFPLALSSVFPIGDAFVNLNRETLEVVETGFRTSFEIPRQGGVDIPRTAFLDNEYQHVSGLVWSRAGIGNMRRSERPLTFIHNPCALNPMPETLGVWDREFVAVQGEDAWEVSDILAESAGDDCL